MKSSSLHALARAAALTAMLLLPASSAFSADDAGIPQALGGSTPAAAPASCPIFDPAQMCALACTCSCPGGITIPAAPAGAPSAGGSPHAGYHSPGMFGIHHGAELPDDSLNVPTAMVDRPLLLPKGVTQPELGAIFYNDSLNTASPVNERLSISSQTSLSDRLQFGGNISVSIRPRVVLDSIFTTTQYSIKGGPDSNGPATSPMVNARFDAGLRHSVCGDGGSAFSGGLGFPAKFKLNPHLALVSGRTSLMAYAYQDDVLGWDDKDCGTTLTLGVPVGLLATLGDTFNFAIRSGYRYLFGSGASTRFIPLAFDFTIVIAGQADVGVTLELPNALGTPADFDQTQTIWFEQRLYVFAQTRF